jgi:Fe-Mn family superoxide dismutase
MTKLTLPPLPYEYNSLEPVISAKIMELHHDKHHLAYVNGANAAIEKLEKYNKGEMEIDVKATMRDLSFHYNGAKMHELFWQNMRPAQENNLPKDEVMSQINNYFGSFDSFKKEFGEAAKQVEGSGWAVLWKTDAGLMVGQLEKHNLLALNGAVPILVLDVWEHAYYLDYLNDRGKYVEAWWGLVNWDDVGKRLSK